MLFVFLSRHVTIEVFITRRHSTRYIYIDLFTLFNKTVINCVICINIRIEVRRVKKFDFKLN